MGSHTEEKARLSNVTPDFLGRPGHAPTSNLGPRAHLDRAPNVQLCKLCIVPELISKWMPFTFVMTIFWQMKIMYFVQTKSVQFFDRWK